jgi:hypothetical protein
MGGDGMGKRRLGVVLWVLAMTGCGGDSDGGGPALDELPARYARAVCAEVVGCFPGGDEERVFGPDGCEASLTAQVEDSDFAYIQDSIDMGRTSYDGSHVQACLSSIEGVGCEIETMRSLGTGACAEIVVGTVEEDGACAIDEDCAPGLRCDAVDCPGSCVPPRGPAEPCEDDDKCEDGLKCVDGLCAAPAELGDACGGGIAGECGLGLICAGDDEGMGVAGECRTEDEVFAGGLGDPCEVIEDLVLCEPGLSCVLRLEGMMLTSSCEEPVGSGEACNVGVPPPCPEDEYCDADPNMNMFEGTCVTLPTAGEACAPDNGPRCEPGLHCDVDVRCHPVNRLGQPCVSDAGCASGSCRDGMCQRPELCEL